MVGNLEAVSLSRRIRRALQEFEAGLEPAESPDLDGSRGSDGQTETVAQQMETLAGELGRLAEMVEAQGGQLQELGRRVAGLEDVARERTAGNAHGAVAGTREGGFPAAAQRAAGTGPQAAHQGEPVGEVPQGVDAGGHAT